jgi:hypothetical protein
VNHARAHEFKQAKKRGQDLKARRPQGKQVRKSHCLSFTQGIKNKTDALA